MLTYMQSLLRNGCQEPLARTGRLAVKVGLGAGEQVRVVAALAQLHHQVLHLAPAVVIPLVLRARRGHLCDAAPRQRGATLHAGELTRAAAARAGKPRSLPPGSPALC